MTTLTVVSVFDSAAGAYGRPVFVSSAGVAVRSFMDEVQRAAPDNEMHRHPSDFHLYKLGVFDDASGRFTCSPDPELIFRGADVPPVPDQSRA